MMKFSALIAAYNAEATLAMTLDSILAQSVPPHEILVFDDGSTDSTPAVLDRYGSRIKVFRQPNQGVAHARNFLCAQAQGEVLAFVDSDDLWHPQYLEFQARALEQYPDAVASFTEREDLIGQGDYKWSAASWKVTVQPELIAPNDFLLRYDICPPSFQMSCCCLRADAVAKLGPEPFHVSGTEDTYLHNLLPTLGPVAHTSAKLGAYRVTLTSLSSNRLRISLLVLEVFARLDRFYRTKENAALYRTFRAVYASRRRNCGKYLMGAQRRAEARKQFVAAAMTSGNPSSVVKSIRLYCLSWFPQSLQPRWLEAQRVLNA